MSPMRSNSHSTKGQASTSPDLVDDASATSVQDALRPSLVSIFGQVNYECISQLHLPQPPAKSLVSILDLGSTLPVTYNQITRGPLLPDHDQVQTQVEAAYANVFSYWPILPRPFFDQAFKRLYGTSPFGDNKVYWDYLALIYSILALGQFVQSTTSSEFSPYIAGRTKQELLWFQMSVSLVDPKDCRPSIVALYTTLCNALYLLLAGSLAQADSFVRHACKVVAEMDLQSLKAAGGEMQDIPQHRTFLAAQLLDGYIALLVGRPRRLSASLDLGTGMSRDDYKGEVSSSALHALWVETQLLDMINHSFETSLSSVIDTPVSTTASPLDLMFIESSLQDWYKKQADRHAAHQAKLEQANNGQSDTTKTLQLAMAHARTRMMTYYPLLPLFFEPATEQQDLLQYAVYCVESALDVTHAATALVAGGKLPACTVHILAFASTALLAWECGNKMKQRGDWTGASRAPSPGIASAAFALLAAIDPAHTGVHEYITIMASVFEQLEQ